MDKGSEEINLEVLDDNSAVITMNNANDVIGKEYYFGFGPFHPNIFQFIFRRKKFFTFLLGSLSFLQSGLVSGIISVVLSSLERRYNMTSTQAALMVIVYDIAAVLGVIFVSYFGSKTHQPRLIGIATLLMSFGSLLFASPQFIFRQGTVDNEAASMGSQLQREECPSVQNNSETCDNVNVVAYIIFIISNIILGLAVTPIYTIGIAYLDEIVYPKYVSIHMGVVSTTLITAPLVGYGFGSQFLSIYVDPWDSTILTERDPAWVGAWWMPFIILSFCFAFLSIPFLMFPRYLPDSHLVREERSKEMAKVYSCKYANENNLSIIFKMFPLHIKSILTNLSFLFVVFGVCSVSLFLQGIVSFGPKYYEVQYMFTPSTAGLVAGGIGIPGAILGTLTGAFVVFGCKMKGRSNTLFMAIMIAITTFMSLVFLLHCPEAKVVGVTIPYEGSQEECQRSCNCTLTSFEPVCGGDGLTYFTPCSAGCVTNSEGNYENCTCINMTDNGTALNGYCESKCWSIIIPAIVLLAVISYVAFVITLPYTHAVIRVVADEQRALALGLQSAMNRVIGTVPGPLIFGALFDLSCLSWQEECGRRGNCWIYDTDKLSVYAISLAIPCMILGAVFFFLSWLTFPKPKV